MTPFAAAAMPHADADATTDTPHGYAYAVIIDAFFCLFDAICR